ncbi:M23 family metallopeptidase [Methylotenera sp. G11]|uniref:M23 family metallopeptidase n=1 Tax=Methylotenera sp. G11 TaxID=1506585 RepID=UPI000646AC1D|nr:M23 family metallopeptidase [Methylotenera sp. G11]
MNIILVSNNMAKAKTLSVLQVSVALAALMFLSVLIAMVLIVPQQPSAQQGAKSLIPNHLRFSFNNPQKHLDAYALQLGELQARMMQLDAQSERLAKLAGEKSLAQDNATGRAKPSKAAPRTEAKPELGSPVSSLPGTANLGGPLVRSGPLSEAELQAKIAELMDRIESSTEQFSSIEAKLLQQSVLKDTLPNSSPVAAAFNSSSFGWRIDPFNGHKAFHEGLDFTAAMGTPIFAAAGGIVSTAEQTPDYGKLVKIDHGSGLETRYAHASRLYVRAGERVEKGQKIAEVGSTGRSTGPHLHYEIRLAGNPLDPRKYLKASN